MFKSSKIIDITFIVANLLFVTLMRLPGMDFIAIETTRIAVNCILFGLRCKNKTLKFIIFLMPLMVVYAVVPDAIVEPVTIAGNVVRYFLFLSMFIVLFFRKRILA